MWHLGVVSPSEQALQIETSPSVLLGTDGVTKAWWGLTWRTSRFNNAAFLYGRKYRRFFYPWFTLGSVVGICAAVCAVVILATNLLRLLEKASDVLSSGNASAQAMASPIGPLRSLLADVHTPSPPSPSPALMPLIPGVNTPVSHIPYIWLSLLTNAVIHELGHAVAAGSDGCRITEAGMFLFFIVPGAFVRLEERVDLELNKRARLRIYCAGSFHNLILAGICWACVLILPTLVAPLFATSQGAAVLQVAQGSALYGHILPGDVLIGLGDCPIHSTEDFLHCVDLYQSRLANSAPTASPTPQPNPHLHPHLRLDSSQPRPHQATSPLPTSPPPSPARDGRIPTPDPSPSRRHHSDSDSNSDPDSDSASESASDFGPPDSSDRHSAPPTPRATGASTFHGRRDGDQRHVSPPDLDLPPASPALSPGDPSGHPSNMSSKDIAPSTFLRKPSRSSSPERSSESSGEASAPSSQEASTVAGHADSDSTITPPQRRAQEPTMALMVRRLSRTLMSDDWISAEPLSPPVKPVPYPAARLGFCISPEKVEKALQLGLDCCQQEHVSGRHCFEELRMSPPFQRLCLRGMDVLGVTLCDTDLDCEGTVESPYMCAKPVLPPDEAIIPFRILSTRTSSGRLGSIPARERRVLFMGNPLELINTLRLSNFVIRMRRLSILGPLDLPGMLECFLRYMFSISAALGFLNMAPVHSLDGQYCVNVLAESHPAPLLGVPAGVNPPARRHKRVTAARLLIIASTVLLLANILISTTSLLFLR